MKDMDIRKYWLYQIRKEFIHRESPYMVNESMGRPDNIDIWTDAVYRKISGWIQKRYKAEGIGDNLITSGRIIIDKNDFAGRECKVFFDKCVIDIVANIDMSGSSFDVSSANFYYPDRSGVCADGSYMIYLKFFLMGDIDKVLADLRPATAHELTHAYVDYRMNPDELMKDRSVGGLDRNFDKKFLHGAAATDDPDIKLIYNILYFTEKDEINAMQSELWSKLLRDRSMIGTSAGANELLKRTEVYKRMESNENRLRELHRVTEEEPRNKILAFFNSVFHSSVPDYWRMLTKVDVMWTRARNRLMNRACKYIGYFQDVKDTYGYIPS